MNSSGQGGDGTLTRHDAPAPVAAQVDFVALVTGWYHTCGLDVERDLYCWGDNSTGALGDASPEVRTLPVVIPSAPDVRFVVAGAAHTCALDSNGNPYCWGSNSNGQLGVLEAIEQCDQGPCSSRPVAVAGGIRFAALAAGRTHTRPPQRRPRCPSPGVSVSPGSARAMTTRAASRRTGRRTAGERTGSGSLVWVWARTRHSLPPSRVASPSPR